MKGNHTNKKQHFNGIYCMFTCVISNELSHFKIKVRQVFFRAIMLNFQHEKPQTMIQDEVNLHYTFDFCPLITYIHSLFA